MTVRPRVVVAAGGVLNTALLPYNLAHLLAHLDIEVQVALSPGAEQFVTTVALQGITGREVYTERTLFDPESGLPFHLACARADVVVLYPASARVIAQCSTGEVTCPVTRVFAFADPAHVIVGVALHPLMNRAIYKPHLERLNGLGCQVLVGDDALQKSLWPEVEAAIAGAVEQPLAPNGPEVLVVSRAPGRGTPPGRAES